MELPFVNADVPAVSGMWTPIASGSAKLDAAIERGQPFVGVQSQRIAISGGDGEVGVANEGLKHQGLAFVGGQPDDGYLWFRVEKPVEVLACLESRDGATRLAEQRISVEGDG